MEAVQLLLRRGADPTIWDIDGVDAIGRMKFWHRHDLARLMETHVAQLSEARVDTLMTLDAVGQRLSVDLDFVQQLCGVFRKWLVLKWRVRQDLNL